MCHGSTGKGDGPVLKKMIDQYGYQPAITPDLTSPQVKFLPDPAIEAFMVSGVVVMPSFAKLLSPEERRLIIEYVRTLQR
jgi:mono/diheme cytochrome c family protein